MKRLIQPLGLAIQLLIVAVLAGTITWILQNDDSQVASENLTSLPVDPVDADAQEEWLAASLTVEEARAFGDFELFWLGEEFMGHRLRRITRTVHDPPPPAPDIVRTDSVTFTYGDCTPVPEADLSCTLPIALHVNAYCTRPPEMIGQLAGGGDRIIRGVLSTSFRDDDLSLWTSDVNVDIQLGDTELLVEEVAEGLMAVNEAGAKAGQNLPAKSVAAC